MNVRDDVSPWSFFMPVTLAVLVGVLAADGVRYALGTTSGDDEAAVQAQGDDPRPPDAGPPALDARGGDPVDPRVVAERTSAGAVVPERAPAGDAALSAEADGFEGGDFPAEDVVSNDVRELPDSMTARRDGDPEACVNGTVVRRVAGGWEQALEDDAPIPCVIVHR